MSCINGYKVKTVTAKNAIQYCMCRNQARMSLTKIDYSFTKVNVFLY